jgi:plasmid stabilization system protein ParE
MRVEYHPQAAADLSLAVDHYNGLQPGLGDALRLEVYAAITRICSNPQRFPEMEGGMRRCFVHRFPYSVLFRCPAADIVRVLVVRHHRRHPNFGLSRR